MNFKYPLCFAFLAFFHFMSPAHAVLWNRIVASYDQNIVTLWDVEKEIQVERMKQGVASAEKISKDHYQSMIKKIIVENLVVREAESFKLGELGPREVENEYLKFKKRFPDENRFKAFLKKYLWSEADLKQVLARPLRVERFIRGKITSVYLYIAEDEVQDYQRRHAGLSVHEIRNRIQKQRVDAHLKEWLEGLKGRHKIRMVWE